MLIIRHSFQKGVVYKMTEYLSSAQLKSLARTHMIGNYGSAIGAFFISEIALGVIALMANTVCDTNSFIGLITFALVYLLTMVIAALFTSGQAYMYLNYVCGNRMVSADIFQGFKIVPEKALLIQLFLAGISLASVLPSMIFIIIYALTENTLFILLFVLFLLIGSVILFYLSITYSQAFFLLHDFPEYSVKELLRQSKRIMKGHKGRYFYITFSFIPLCLLCLLSFGLGALWVQPYIYATQAEFFIDIMKK